MQEPLRTGVPIAVAPSFYLTSRQPLRPGAILMAIVAAVGALSLVLNALRQTGQAHLSFGDSAPRRSTSAAAGAAPSADDEDDPNQVDTIVLGDPADAPTPARRGDHVSSVHPTILIRLPRFGDQTGLIPDTPSGRLLFRWLAAFNQANRSAIGDVLPNDAGSPVTGAQMDLRQWTGGFNLLSAKEVQPGVLVFRLRDQTPAAAEVLGTLQVRPNSSPAVIASFSLRGVASPLQDAPAASVPLPDASRH